MHFNLQEAGKPIVNRLLFALISTYDENLENRKRAIFTIHNFCTGTFEKKESELYESKKPCGFENIVYSCTKS